MKIAVLNDTHAGVRQSSDIFIEYQKIFYEDVFFPYLKKHDINRILHLGDYYDSRRGINFKALNANRRMFLDVLREEQIHMDIFPGNHDVYYSNTNKLCSLKELHGWYLNEVSIYMEPAVITYEPNFNIALIPWVNKENVEEIHQFLDNLNENEIDIVAGHFEFTGFEMLKGLYSAIHNQLVTVSDFARFKQVISGHFHRKSRRKNVMYLGAQMEFTWSDYDDPKYFHVIDTETGKIRGIRNPHTIFAKIVYNDVQYPKLLCEVDFEQYENKFIKLYVEEKSNSKMFNKFLDNLYRIKTHDIKIIENFDSVLSQADNQSNNGEIISTEQIISEYIDDINITNTEYSRDVIKSKFNQLYNDALSIEL